MSDQRSRQRARWAALAVAAWACGSAAAADDGPAAAGGLHIPIKSAEGYCCPPGVSPAVVIVGDKVWDLRTGQDRDELLDDVPARPIPAAVSTDGALFATVPDREGFKRDQQPAAGTIVVWSTTTGQRVATLAAGSSRRQPSFLAFSGPTAKELDKWLIVIGPNDAAKRGEDRSLYRADVWDLGTGKVAHTFPLREPSAGVAAISPDGRSLALIGGDHVYVYDVRAGHQSAVMRDPPLDPFATPGKAPAAATPEAPPAVTPRASPRAGRSRGGQRTPAVGAAAAAAAAKPGGPPLYGDYGWGGGLAWSPNGRELAGLFSGRLSHKPNRLIIWDTSGHVAFDTGGRQVAGEFGGSSEEGQFRDVQWSPDGTQLLLADDWLFDRKAAMNVWHLPSASRGADLRSSALLGDGRVLAWRDDALNRPGELATVDVPAAEVKATLAALANAKAPASLRPGQHVGLSVELTGTVRGDAGQTKDELTKAMTAGLTANGLPVTDGSPATFRVTFDESAGDTREVYESHSPVPSPFAPGTDTGQKATGAKSRVTVELRVAGSADPVWSDRIDGYSPGSMAGPVNDGTLRAAMLQGICWQLGRIVVPTFVPGDRSLKVLPIRAE